jgi:hypothetical protein
VQSIPIPAVNVTLSCAVQQQQHQKSVPINAIQQIFSKTRTLWYKNSSMMRMRIFCFMESIGNLLVSATDGIASTLVVGCDNEDSAAII